jgi:hypothetical protein
VRRRRRRAAAATAAAEAVTARLCVGAGVEKRVALRRRPRLARAELLLGDAARPLLDEHFGVQARRLAVVVIVVVVAVAVVAVVVVVAAEKGLRGGGGGGAAAAAAAERATGTATCKYSLVMPAMKAAETVGGMGARAWYGSGLDVGARLSTSAISATSARERLPADATLPLPLALWPGADADADADADAAAAAASRARHCSALASAWSTGSTEPCAAWPPSPAVRMRRTASGSAPTSSGLSR